MAVAQQPQAAWGVKDDKFPIYSGASQRRPDVVFTGTMTDVQGGGRAKRPRVWKFNVESGIVANPIHLSRAGTASNTSPSIRASAADGRGRLPRGSADDPDAALGVFGAIEGTIKKLHGAGSTVYFRL